MASHKSSPDLFSQGTPSYFDLQAYIGTTKHMGGAQTTAQLIELCHINQDTYVLDVGCGAGATACHLALTCGCRVMAVDIREDMLTLTGERARKKDVAHLVELRSADAQELPFEDGKFDIVICESVLAFIEDKSRAINEFIRVAVSGGFIGINEVLITTNIPPEDLIKFAQMNWGIEHQIPTAQEWQALLVDAGLRNIITKDYKMDIRRESSQVGRYDFSDMARMVKRIFALYLKSPPFRRYMKDKSGMPKGVFNHLGYGIFVGQKSDR